MTLTDWLILADMAVSVIFVGGLVYAIAKDNGSDDLL